MGAKRVTRGMHRLGLGLAAIPIAIGAGVIGTLAWRAVTSSDDDYRALKIVDLRDALEWIPAFLISAGIIYAVCWGVGWIIAGFLADE